MKEIAIICLIITIVCIAVATTTKKALWAFGALAWLFLGIYNIGGYF